MEKWYLPITILPGLGMLIMSTVTLTLSVSEEINKLLSKKCTPFYRKILEMKLKQLGLLTRANALLYGATGVYVLSGILGALLSSNSYFDLASITLYIGTILMFLAIILLVTYAFKAIKIRRIQFENNQFTNDEHA